MQASRLMSSVWILLFPFFCFVPVIIINFSVFITFYKIQLVIGFSTLSINRGIVPWSRAWSNWCSRTRCLLYWCRSTMLISTSPLNWGSKRISSSNPPACSSGCLRSSSLFSRLSLINTFCTEKLINESHAHAIWGQMYFKTETAERATMVSSPGVESGLPEQSHV
jgi:hypothetical protein